MDGFVLIAFDTILPKLVKLITINETQHIEVRFFELLFSNETQKIKIFNIAFFKINDIQITTNEHTILLV